MISQYSRPSDIDREFWEDYEKLGGVIEKEDA